MLLHRRASRAACPVVFCDVSGHQGGRYGRVDATNVSYWLGITVLYFERRPIEVRKDLAL